MTTNQNTNTRTNEDLRDLPLAAAEAAEVSVVVSRSLTLAVRAGCEVATDCGLFEVYSPVGTTFRNGEHVVWHQDIAKATWEVVPCKDLSDDGYCDFCSNR